MRLPRGLLVGALLTLSISRAALAQGLPADRLLVSTAWLAEHLNDANLVLLHVGTREEYDAGHIAGARYTTMQEVSAPRQEGALSLQLPAIEQLLPQLEAMGISDDSRIVLYWGNDWLTPTTRIAFTLDWAGLGDRLSILDGGMPEWKREGRALTADPPPARTGKLNPRRPKDSVATVDWVLEHVKSPWPNVRLIDARAPTYYLGVEPSQGVNGHIPGAANIPFTELATDEMRITDLGRLRALFEAAGAKPGDTIVTYCHIGQQATATLFAARLLGYDVRLFDGSMNEWARDPARPVTKEPGRQDGATIA
ncbi:MAG: hypothetical protein L0271_07325 [Gemmatimonadetes bacterium]|nr:hypothetical protein [Gemmatimonadota bacterium]